ncbi:MBL fold metallo-hydrolase [Streptomyces platensis]|uniref:MBL fold metallo-hydrolase n=1 Tax=Streptomyces platensis TaxID=58346 RepID=UPI001F1F95D8|nr:MBL fold metallo-hydrolase [Streptomyces platensis]MCF3144003.1 MBL fold metallo-hydrolase [Streptomyces platensis]
MESMMLGGVEITRVVEKEWHTRPPHEMFPDLAPDFWERNRSWLAPDFWDADDGRLVSCAHTWVLRSEGKVVLIDTGIGNDKERPGLPPFHRQRGDFLGALARAGVEPADVDIVVNTHLHADHVGWNTRLAHGEWVPTFPNATYLLPEPDYHFWNPARAIERRSGAANRNVFEDSVEPVVRAGRSLRWSDGYVIDPHLRLEPAPGHTPGSAVVVLESGTDRAVFAGDLLHNPAQVVAPDCNSCFCEDQEQARASRRRVLQWAADHTALVLPAHVRGGAAFEVASHGSAFAITRWADLPGNCHGLGEE